MLTDLRYAIRVGQTVTINGRAFSIVGVGSQRFMGTEPRAADVWVPLAAQPILDGTNRLTDRMDSWLLVMGRLRPGIEPAAVERDLSVVASRLSAAYPAPDRPRRVSVAPGTFFTFDSPAWSVIGLVLGALATARVLSSWLPGVSPADSVARGAATAFLGLIASIACYLPARRAAAIDPMVALRSD